ncbi:MAG: hypothetical protein MJE68_14410, partial [Proteobacteria bacterium]|nr:hypothetical protein [Pseudomonadota bacterium]
MYNTTDLTEEPEIIQAKQILVQQKVKTVIDSLERDIDDFAIKFQRYMDTTVERAKRAVKRQNELKLPLKPELRHQYGMLFNHHGYMMPGLKSLQLFLAVDLPKINDLQHDPPAFPNCTNWAAPNPPNMNYYGTMGEVYVKWTAYRELNESLSFLDETVHHKVCIQYERKYNNLLRQIRNVKEDIIYKIRTVMPRLLPNERALLFGKHTSIVRQRQKRAIPLGLIFSGVSAIG